MTEKIKLKSIIVDDEAASRETLQRYLEKYCPKVEVVDTADSAKTGVVSIENHNPDLVFLDVEMPFGNAFDLLEEIENINFETIFVTAYSNYAIQALNMSASYYLLKPVDIDQLCAAVDKVYKQKEKNEVAVHSKILFDNIQSSNKQLQKIVLPQMEGFDVVFVKDIVRCQANDNFTDFHFVDGKKTMVCRTLKHFEEILSDFDFVRTHKSHMVNIQHVSKYLKGKGGQLVMSDGSVVDVSPKRKKDVMNNF